jgi:hypothetical protein
MQKTAREPVLVDLALQGGGSHGAFTWGVLDRLIDEPRCLSPQDRADGMELVGHHLLSVFL